MREVKDMENFLIQAAYDEKAVETESAREITASGVPLVIPAEYLGMERMEGTRKTLRSMALTEKSLTVSRFSA